MKISFVIPCYRSERTIASVVSEIIGEVSKRPGIDYEVVMVSDHSPDGVYSVIERLCHDDPAHLKGLELARGFWEELHATNIWIINKQMCIFIVLSIVLRLQR